MASSRVTDERELIRARRIRDEAHNMYRALQLYEQAGTCNGTDFVIQLQAKELADEIMGRIGPERP